MKIEQWLGIVLQICCEIDMDLISEITFAVKEIPTGNEVKSFDCWEILFELVGSNFTATSDRFPILKLFLRSWRSSDQDLKVSGRWLQRAYNCVRSMVYCCCCCFCLRWCCRARSSPIAASKHSKMAPQIWESGGIFAREKIPSKWNDLRCMTAKSFHLSPWGQL